MTVLGVRAPVFQSYEHSSMRVFVEVHNPGDAELSLRGMSYELEAEGWFRSEGKVALSRTILGGGSAIVEIDMPISKSAQAPEDPRGVPYVFRARLHGKSNRVDNSWKLVAKGALTSRNGTSIRPTTMSR